MSRKIYALFILIGAIGALVLVYLYFFVYYTSTLIINANVEDYNVELFSLATAQKWSHECPEKICVIADVSPFDYNISISKTEYESKIISAKIGARRKETIVVELEKKVSLVSIKAEEYQETNQQKIQRLRDEKNYYVHFELSDEISLNFLDIDDQMLLQYKSGDGTRDIGHFGIVAKDNITIDNIPETEDIFLSLGDEYYIFDTQKFSLTKLPFDLEINYLKSASTDGKYLVVTEKGTFLYDISDNSSEFQYLFKDFLYSGDDIIGIIYDDENQKKSNFNITQSGNLIIKYSPKDKTRKVIETTSLNITRLEWRGGKIIFSAGENEYELKNFD